jgi:hypothetical protein
LVLLLAHARRAADLLEFADIEHTIADHPGEGLQDDPRSVELEFEAFDGSSFSEQRIGGLEASREL